MVVEYSLDGLNEQDAHNYQQAKKAAGEMWRLPDDVAAVYELHHQSIGPRLNTTAQRVAGVLIHGLCLKHLMVGDVITETSSRTNDPRNAKCS